MCSECVLQDIPLETAVIFVVIVECSSYNIEHFKANLCHVLTRRKVDLQRGKYFILKKENILKTNTKFFQKTSWVRILEWDVACFFFDSFPA